MPSPVSPECPIATMPTGWARSVVGDATVTWLGSVGDDEVALGEHPASTTIAIATRAPAFGDVWANVWTYGRPRGPAASR